MMVGYEGVIAIYVFQRHFLSSICIIIIQWPTVIPSNSLNNFSRFHRMFASNLITNQFFYQPAHETLVSDIFAWNMTSVIFYSFLIMKKITHFQRSRSMNTPTATNIFFPNALNSNSTTIILHKFIFVSRLNVLHDKILLEFNNSTLKDLTKPP